MRKNNMVRWCTHCWELFGKIEWLQRLNGSWKNKLWYNHPFSQCWYLHVVSAFVCVCALIWQQHMRTSTFHSHDRNVFLHGSTECCLSFDLDVRSSNWKFLLYWPFFSHHFHSFVFIGSVFILLSSSLFSFSLLLRY